MSDPLISVLIPTYNVEKYIREAVESISNQTYRNLEIIVVDDGSTDNTHSILEELRLKDSRIRLFKMGVNRGIVETLNFALTQATGTYIARMDGDDVSMPERLQKQYLFLQQHPDVALVGLNIIIVNEQGQLIYKDNYLYDFDKIRLGLKYASPIPHVWLTTRELYRQIGNYRIQTAEDFDFILRAIDAGFEVTNHPEYLYSQRIRHGNTSTTSGLLQRKAVKYALKLHQERAESGQQTDSYSDTDLQLALKSGTLERIMFQRSSDFHYHYLTVKNKSRFVSLFWLSLAVLVSPYHQISHLYKRKKYKKLKNLPKT
jgi:glycosyltransferase involved in cell wall biosynthesis